MTTLEDAAGLGRREQGLVVVSTLRADQTMREQRRTAVFVAPSRVYGN